MQLSTNRGKTNVIDLRICTPHPAAGDADLEFSGQVVKVGVAGQQLIGLERQWRSVADFVSIDSRKRAAGDVARNVAARGGSAEGALHQALQNFRKGFNRYPVKLDVLPDGQICDTARIALGQVCDCS